MNQLINELKQLIEETSETISNSSNEELEFKRSENKWSKKEILGHLVDSALNNLQRFTEIQFDSKPYIVRTYNQVGLVMANGYQQTPIENIKNIWVALNEHICTIIMQQSEESLNYEVLVPDGEMKDLRWLIEDYVDHMRHHVRQIQDLK